MYFAYSGKQYARGWLGKKVLVLTYVTISSLKDTVKYKVKLWTQLSTDHESRCEYLVPKLKRKGLVRHSKHGTSPRYISHHSKYNA